jgi:hypothetical protein
MIKRLLTLSIPLCLIGGIAQADSGKLNRIFSRANIYAPISQIEKIAGKPVSSHGEEHIFKVGQCEVAVYADSLNDTPDIVQEIAMDISPTCTFDLSRVVKVPKGTYVHKLTFGKFGQIMPTNLLCPSSCAPDTTDCPIYQKAFTLTWLGSGTIPGAPPIVVTNDLTSRKTRQAASKWEAFIQKKEGAAYKKDNWSSLANYKYSKEGLRFFRNVPIAHIQVGSIGGMLECQ